MKKANFNYGNFQDPIGLVIRMLKSRDKAAYSALLRELCSILLLPVDRILQLQEDRLLRQKKRSSMPIILVVGPPRSGTTLVYQTLAQYLPVSFFNNLSASFPHSPITACRLFSRLFPSKTNSFHNFYGNTVGFSEPNDGFHIWDRWLGKDRYSINQHLSSAAKQDMQNFFAAWMNTFQRPLLNKNNRNTICISLLSSIFDNIFFVVVQRDPIYIAQSLLIAREKIQGDQNVGWGLGSKNSEILLNSGSPAESVTQQVAHIFKVLDEQKRLVDSSRIIDVPYEQFCLDPTFFAKKIYSRVWRANLDSDILRQNIQPFEQGNKIRLPINQFEQLEMLIADQFQSLSY